MHQLMQKLGYHISKKNSEHADVLLCQRLPESRIATTKLGKRKIGGISSLAPKPALDRTWFSGRSIIAE
jgi:hypothetical protein